MNNRIKNILLNLENLASLSTDSGKDFSQEQVEQIKSTIRNTFPQIYSSCRPSGQKPILKNMETSRLATENARLKCLVSEQAKDIDTLKKATIYFAKHQN